MSRQSTLAAIRSQPNISVLIIGGGINGVGLFRELALQGVDVLLVEKSDFCAGTSAASTRVIHGGLRYLENGEFRLVREALQERNRLLINAPHTVKPLATTIPIFSWTKGLIFAAKKFLGFSDKPGDRGALLIKMGLTLYDAFSGRQGALPKHRFASKAAALAQRPQLNPDIVCTATYYDAQIKYPERLCLELILDAESPSARALNYVRVVGAEGDAVTLRDEIPGENLTVRPQIVVNATGAWIDFTNRAMHHETQFIGGTKGSHLVINNPQLYEATKGQMLYFATPEGRICIFYSFGDKVIAGSTDIPADDPETAVCDQDEEAYILDSIRHVFPSIQVDRSHVVFRFCGVRPLPRNAAATTGQISRDHHCALTPPDDDVKFPIYSLIGGKWTTFRAFSEQVADQILPIVGKTRKTRSENLPIGGGKNYPKYDADKERWVAENGRGLPKEQVLTLLERYGTRAAEIMVFIAAESDSPLVHHPAYSRREIEFLASCERVTHLDDLILRRTLIGMLGKLDKSLLEELANIVAPVLKWSPDQTKSEIERTAQIFKMIHGVNIE
jgi:glycerol-3-phosphate dehydrogenase